MRKPHFLGLWLLTNAGNARIIYFVSSLDFQSLQGNWHGRLAESATPVQPQPKKATHKQTKVYNTRLVLKTVYDNDRSSRADVARLTHLTRTTVSDIVADLIAQGLVKEVGRGPSAGGKSPIQLSVVDDARLLIGVDLANDAFRGAVVDLRGHVLHTTELPLGTCDGEQALAEMHRLVDGLVKAAGRPLLGIGIGAPGLIDTQQGLVRRAVNLDWQDLPLAQLVQSRYRLPVYLGNDSQLAALAQFVFGGAPAASNLVVLKIGQGLGAGIVLNGQLFQGDGFGAGEIGHTIAVENGLPCRCGNRGCLETVASTRAMVERARSLAPEFPQSTLAAAPAAITTGTLTGAFLAGDALARRVVLDAARYLGAAAANLVGALNVQRIIISGTAAAFGPAFAEAIEQELPGRALPALARETHVEVAALVPDNVILGASALLLMRELGLDLIR